jgi:hypothetical protein
VGTLVFYFLATSQNVHAFAMTRQRYGYFTVAQPGKVKTDVGEMLKSLGHYDRTQPVDAANLRDEAWRTPADRLLGQLTNQTKPEEWANYKELVIVPDGVLWYLPFEALPVKAGETTNPLLSLLPIRYAPTLSLAIPDKRGLRPAPRTAIVGGKLLPRDTDEAAIAQREHVAGVAPGAVVLTEEPPVTSSIFGATFDSLVVMSEVEEGKSPFGWSPLVLDGGKPGSTLADWGLLPWAGVEQVVLPGFHTPAEYGLKRGGAGDEVFLALCGLMASGSRTVLLSRWRVGGQTTANLMGEFVQELPHEPAAAAWRRSVQLSFANLIDPEAEGRLKTGPAADGLKADHPFFWSGYLLADTGLAPAKEAKAEAAPAADPPAKPVADAAAR